MDEEIEKYNIKLYKNAKFSLDGDSVTVKLNSSKEEIKKVEKIAAPLVDVLNAMECFSSYFTSELADENVAFRAVGKTFCSTVRKLMPEFAHLTPKGYFTNTFNLFLQWNKKLEHKNLLKEKASIEQKLLEIDNKKIKPFGA